MAALRSGTLVVQPVSIHALVGENGAGKSTLVKIAGGVHRRDAGVVELDGEPVDFSGPADAKTAGVLRSVNEIGRSTDRSQHQERRGADHAS